MLSICKIWVKKGHPKRKWWGALVGLIQGVLISLFVLSPLTGILVQVDKISKVQIGGEALFELPEEIGINEYVESPLGKIYYGVGGWYFDIVTSTKTEEGNKVSIDDTIDIVVTVTDIADTVTGLTDSIEKMSNLDFSGNPTEADIHEAVVAMDELGNALIEIGTQIDNLSADAKALINGVLEGIKDMIPEDEADDEEMAEVMDALENLSIEDLDLAGVGNAIKGVAVILDKTEGTRQNEEIAQTEVTQIVSGLASNEFILNLIPDEEPLLDINDLEDEESEEGKLVNMFVTAINSLPAGESKAKLQFLFGLN